MRRKDERELESPKHKHMHLLQRAEEDNLIENKTTEAKANPGQGRKSNATIVVRRDTTKVNVDS